jgi:hypothetical protein
VAHEKGSLKKRGREAGIIVMMALVWRSGSQLDLGGLGSKPPFVALGVDNAENTAPGRITK